MAGTAAEAAVMRYRQRQRRKSKVTSSDIDAAMYARLCKVLDKQQGYPADLLPWPQIDSDNEGAAERRIAGWLAWRDAEAEVIRLRDEGAAAQRLLRDLVPHFERYTDGTEWALSGRIGMLRISTEVANLLAQLDAEQ